MGEYLITHWKTIFFSGTLVVINWITNLFSLHIIMNWPELWSKVITAGIVGFGGGAAGVLGKYFIAWCRKMIFKFRGVGK